MTWTKNKTVSEIGRRTRLTNHEVQVVLETLFEVWSEALIAGEKIEIEHFLVLEVKTIRRGSASFEPGTRRPMRQPEAFRQVVVHTSRQLRQRLREG